MEEAVGHFVLARSMGGMDSIIITRPSYANTLSCNYFCIVYDHARVDFLSVIFKDIIFAVVCGSGGRLEPKIQVLSIF
jgi:hypothetical protein